MILSNSKGMIPSGTAQLVCFFLTLFLSNALAEEEPHNKDEDEGDMCFEWPWLSNNNQSVFEIALANQEQHTDLGVYENRNKRGTCFEWPWRYKNDQCAFGGALANREQCIVFD